jgi:hypothetical protein
MCPFCLGTMKLIHVGGRPTLGTYQCLDCTEVMTTEGEARIDSYFEWLMSRPRSKRSRRLRCGAASADVRGVNAFT